MNTQPSPATLTLLARQLRDVHKILIDLETQYFGNVGSPLEHLQLLTNHPHFAWLQKLSGLMAAFDERLDQPEAVTEEEAAGFRAAIENLLGPAEPGDADFQRRYRALLHDAPELVMAHGALRGTLASLPKAATR
jgi:hypothetical protein